MEEARRILCVESQKDICDLIALMLEEKGYMVRTAQNVREGLEKAMSEHFDLYILNDTYTDGTSLELLKQLRAYDPATPVLLFSLEGRHGNPRANLEYGIQTFDSRTSDFVSLVQTIDRLLRADDAASQ